MTKLGKPWIKIGKEIQVRFNDGPTRHQYITFSVTGQKQ